MTDPARGSAGSSISATKVRYISFGITVVVVIALVAADVIPLWLGAVIVLADGAFTYALIVMFQRDGAG